MLTASAALVLAMPAGWAQPARRTGGGVGTVSTLVGPGFCPHSTSLDPASLGIRALAVGVDGTVHAEVGRPGEGLVATVNASGSGGSTATGLTGDRPNSGRPGNPGPRLVPDRNDAFVAANDSRIVRFGPGPTTLAGDPELQRVALGPGDGPADEARFQAIRGLASDDRFNVYVADAIDPQRSTVAIRFFNRTDVPATFYPGTAQELTVAPGHIETIAGSGDGSDGTTKEVTLSGVMPAMAVVGSRLYIALTNPSRQGQLETTVRIINLGGEPVVTHGLVVAPGAMAAVAGAAVAGGGGTDPVKDGQSARSGTLAAVPGIAADAEGNLYLAEQARHRIRRVDPAGILTTFAGAGPPVGGFNGNDRPATTARLDRPSDVKVGPGGRIFIADTGNGQLRVVEPNGQIRAGFGNGLARVGRCAQERDSRPNADAEGSRHSDRPRPGSPGGLAVSPAGDTVVALTTLGRVVRLGPSGITTTVAGGTSGRACPPEGCRGSDIGDGGPALEAVIREPLAVAWGSEGMLYVLDRTDGRVRVVNLGHQPRRIQGVTLAPGTIQTVAGSGPAAAPLDDEADREDDHGTGAAPDGDGGPAVAARLNFEARVPGSGRRHAFGLAADTDGNLFVADGTGVRMVDPAGTISTVLPSHGQPCCTAPAGLALDGAGNLYVSDAATARVWLLNRGGSPLAAHGQTIAPGQAGAIAGSGTAGFGGDEGPALDAQLAGFAGLIPDPEGNLYLAVPSFGGDNSVRRVDPAGVITTVVGGTARGFNGDGLPAALTSLTRPTGVALDRCGNLLVSDTSADRVRRATLAASCIEATTSGEQQHQNRKPWTMVAFAGILMVAGVVLGRLAARHRSNREKADLSVP